MTKSLLRPAVFLDRDGTLIFEKNYLSRPEDVQLVPGAAKAVNNLRRAGYVCVVVTNQSGIGRGMFTVADVEAVHAEMMKQLAEGGAVLDGIYYCPDAPTTSDKSIIETFDRKPGPGMLLRAAAELGLDIKASWMIGDGLVDLLAGRNAGCRGSILVRSGHSIDDAVPHLRGEPVLNDVLEAAKWIEKSGVAGR